MTEVYSPPAIICRCALCEAPLFEPLKLTQADNAALNRAYEDGRRRYREENPMSTASELEDLFGVRSAKT